MPDVNKDYNKQLFEPLRQALARYLKRKQVDLVSQAFFFAANAHETQKRSSGEPYITHPVAVAIVLAKQHLDPDTIMAALLHDVMEDTRIDKALISKKFGPVVANLVDGVSKLTHVRFDNKAEAQAENFRKMLLAMAKDIRVVVVKMADRLHNMRTLGALLPYKRRRIARETMEIHVPLANRLGMHRFRIELEDLCFQAMYPLRYQVLEKQVKNVSGNRRSVMEIIETAINDCLKAHKLRNITLVGRQKHLYGIYSKMRSKRIPFEEVMDMFAFRIIVSSQDECYIALGLVHNLYKPMSERFKDYIAIPKANGYQSLHTTLFGPYAMPIEVQIRTPAMHELAERGVAAHWLYKDGKRHEELSAAEQRTKTWLQDLLEMQRDVTSSVEFIENVKFDLFPEEVYVFSPKGDIFELPHGATAIDFAYAIHSDIGNSCIAIKIDKRYVLLSTLLKNGQTVEVITAEHGTPKLAWLDFVATAKARSNIRHYVKRQQRHEALQLGQQLLSDALKFYRVTLDDIDKKHVDKLLQSLQFSHLDELYCAIGMGDRIANVIAQELVDKDNLAMQSELDQPSAAVIHGTEGVMVTYAKCCYPIPGDAIIGYWLPTGQLLVHVADCPKISAQQQSDYHGLPLRWGKLVEGYFEVAIQLKIFDEKGLLALITQAMLREDVSVKDVKLISGHDESQLLDFVILIHSSQHLTRVLKRLKHLSGVIDAKRHFII